jgi:hypothetical protein
MRHLTAAARDPPARIDSTGHDAATFAGLYVAAIGVVPDERIDSKLTITSLRYPTPAQGIVEFRGGT